MLCSLWLVGSTSDIMQRLGDDAYLRCWQCHTNIIIVLNIFLANYVKISDMFFILILYMI